MILIYVLTLESIVEIQNEELEILDKFEGDSNENTEADKDVVVCTWYTFSARSTIKTTKIS